MGIHEGHRERLRGLFLEHGLNGISDLNSLELLLFFAIPRKDTNEIAHRLFDRFDSLEGVFNASYCELLEVEGVGKTAAALIKLVPEIMRKSKISAAARIKCITDSDSAAEYIMPRFLYEQEEILFLICLDSMKKVISCVEINRGIVNAVETNVRRIVEIALKYRASSVILAHNHPDGLALPSREDETTTRLALNSLNCVGIKLADHIVVAGDDYVSFADSGMFRVYCG